MRARSFVLASLFCAFTSASAFGAAPTPEPTQNLKEDDVVFDNTGLTDELARKSAADRRQKYQGDSPFAPDGEQPPERDSFSYSHSKNEDRFRPLALTLNPITLALGRFGANVEWLPAPHHGIMLNPYYSSFELEGGSSKTTYQSFGAELGYHFYSGSRGANGFFAGPSFVFTRTTTSYECSSAGCSSGADSALSTYGVAFDVGGQYVFSNGMTIGGGGGLMYLRSTETAEGGTAFKFQGTLPRMLFTLGYSI